MRLIGQLYEALGLTDRIVPYRAVVDHVRQHPELATINTGAKTWTPPDRAGLTGGRTE